MKKITLLNVQNWTSDNLKESSGNEYYISFYDSLASYVSDASDDPDIWDYLRTVLDQYGSSITTMLQHKDPVAIVSKTGGEVDSIKPVYSSIFFEGYSLTSVLNELEKDYYSYGACNVEEVLYAIERFLKHDEVEDLEKLYALSIDSNGIILEFGCIYEYYAFSEVESEVLNELSNVGIDPYRSEIFKSCLKSLVSMTVAAMEYYGYIPKDCFK